MEKIQKAFTNKSDVFHMIKFPWIRLKETSVFFFFPRLRIKIFQTSSSFFEKTTKTTKTTTTNSISLKKRINGTVEKNFVFFNGIAFWK